MRPYDPQIWSYNPAKMHFNPKNTKKKLQFYLKFTTIYLQFNLKNNFLSEKSQKNGNGNHDDIIGSIE